MWIRCNVRRRDGTRVVVTDRLVTVGPALKDVDNKGIRRALNLARWMAGEPLECHWCSERFERLKDLTVDHLVPRWNGGAHSPSNAVLACQGCNGLRDQWDRYEAGFTRKQPKEEW